MSALLHYVPGPHGKMLLATLKHRAENAARTAGRAPAGSQAHRLVPLSDSQYVSQLEMMVATLKIPLGGVTSEAAKQRRRASGKSLTVPSAPVLMELLTQLPRTE